jgi:hypothetical protein
MTDRLQRSEEQAEPLRIADFSSAILLQIGRSEVVGSSEILERVLGYGIGGNVLDVGHGTPQPANRPVPRRRLGIEVDSRLASSAQNREGAAEIRPEAENGEVMIEGSRALYAQAAHDSEAGAVDDRKILVGICESDLPSGFQVRCAHEFYRRDTTPQAFPKSVRDVTTDTRSQQAPGFAKNVIGG